MQTKLKQEFHQQEFAKWQNKGKNIEINNQVKQRLASLRQAAAVNLQTRKYSPLDLDKNLRSCSPPKIRLTVKKSSPCSRRPNRHAREWPKESRSSKRKNKKDDWKMSTKDSISAFSKMRTNSERSTKILRNLSLPTNAIFSLWKSSPTSKTNMNVPPYRFRINAVR